MMICSPVSASWGRNCNAALTAFQRSPSRGRPPNPRSRLFWEHSIELVANRADKSPLSAPLTPIAPALVRRTGPRGMMVYPRKAAPDAQTGTTLLLAPALLPSYPARDDIHRPKPSQTLFRRRYYERRSPRARGGQPRITPTVEPPTVKSERAVSMANVY